MHGFRFTGSSLGGILPRESFPFSHVGALPQCSCLARLSFEDSRFLPGITFARDIATQGSSLPHSRAYR